VDDCLEAVEFSDDDDLIKNDDDGLIWCHLM
jgi:hypothetical protein